MSKLAALSQLYEHDYEGSYHSLVRRDVGIALGRGGSAYALRHHPAMRRYDQ